MRAYESGDHMVSNIVPYGAKYSTICGCCVCMSFYLPGVITSVYCDNVNPFALELNIKILLHPEC